MNSSELHDQTEKAALIQHGRAGYIQQGTTAVCLAGAQPVISTSHLTELITLINTIIRKYRVIHKVEFILHWGVVMT